MSNRAQRKLAEAIAECTHDPFAYARLAFPWGEAGTLLADSNGPRDWQRQQMEDIKAHLSNPATRFMPYRDATASGHGIGKTGQIGMLTCWALDTHEDSRVLVTANTEPQIRTKLWPEILRWRNMSITRDWWRVTKTGIFSKAPGHEESWRADAVTWSANNTEAFQGLHNARKRIVILTDESSRIDDGVFSVIEGALTDEDTELLWLPYSNPTRSTGRFKECFGKYRHLWTTRNIDARTVEGTNKTYLDELISTYGIDSDIARVRVLGQFPSQSSLTFIGTDVVEEARRRILPTTDYLPSDPVIFGLDHARFGDDQTVLAIRQGRDARSRPWQSWSGANSMEIAGRVAEAASRYHPDAIFIDAGGPNAGGVIDRLRQLLGDDADRVFEIHFGSKTAGMEAGMGAERVLVANQRAKMWTDMRNWLPRGVIPDFQRLADDLIGPEYSYDLNNAILLEKKIHMKARGLASPDWGDALALTFAAEVMPRRVPEYLNPTNYRPDREYDRYADLNDDDGYDELYERYGTAMPSCLRKSY